MSFEQLKKKQEKQALINLSLPPKKSVDQKVRRVTLTNVSGNQQ